ncbi:MAG: DUF3105 domain-containing protein [Rhodococcus sp. (in: high G+C Gram-positive bacteria)]|uniref:DUF3105 domain-containing protein n=1 Tax=Rhodococcus sp. TaxID=1831 RepID=UPI003BB12A91
MPSGSESRGPGKNAGAKSAKALKAAKKNSGGQKSKVGGAKPPRNIPWLTIGAAVAVLTLVGILAINLVPKYQAKEEAARYAPSADNPDPSVEIDGVAKVDYPAGIHIQPMQRVAYDQSPPFGGPHDANWATCTGTVYPEAIRSENAVHSLEHGAVWIAYNPDTVPADQVETLKDKVDGESFTLLSPYPGLDSPISLQSWGHQLKLDSADDERIDQFVSALRINKNTYPEVGASCSSIPGSGFDPDNPPAFDAAAPGPDAVPMDGGNIEPDQTETGGMGQLPSGMQLPTDLQQTPTGGQ